jgi:formylglycine-generating enzyme required for sulfatase activity
MKMIVFAAGVTTTLLAGAMALLAPDGSGGISLPAFQAVTLDDGRVLYVQKREVSIALWNRCHAAEACPFPLASPEASGEAFYPATGLSWIDATVFSDWPSAESGHALRFPTRHEWREVARDVLPDAPEPLFNAPELAWASTYLLEQSVPRRLKPAGMGDATPEGIDDLTNNVWEWTADCAPGADANRCPAYFAAGLHDAVIPFLVRDPARGGCAVGTPPPHLGMRLVSDEPL